MESKTPEYTKRAINNYIAKKDRITILCEKGTAERIRQTTGKSVNAFLNELIEKELTRIENETKNQMQDHNENINAVDPADVFINYKE